MIDKHDPRLTDYVLGELGEQESARIEAEIQASDELKHAVAEIQQAKIWLSAAFESEPELSLLPEQRASILESARQSRGGGVTAASTLANPFGSQRLAVLATVAALLMLLVGGGLYFNQPDNTDRTDSVALQSEREADSTQESAVATDSAIDKTSLPDVAQPESKPDVDGATGVSLAEGSGSDIEPEMADDSQIRSADVNTRGATPKSGSAPAQPAGGLNEVPDVPRLAAGDQPLNPADASGRSARSPNAFTIPVDPGSPSPSATVLENLERRLRQLGDLSQKSLVRSIERQVKDQVIQQTRELLDQSELRLLELQVTTRQQPVTTQLRYGITAFQQKQIHSLVPPEELGDQPRKQTDLFNQPVRQRVEREINQQVIEPVISIEPDQARVLVDRLASAVDPDQTQVLSLESLLALDNPIDWGVESLPKLAQSDADGSAAVGGYSAEEKLNQPLDRATFRFVQALNSFIDSRTLSEDDESIISRPLETNTIDLATGLPDEAEFKLADAGDAPAADQQSEAQQPTAPATRMRMAPARQTDPIISIPLIPSSVDQLDFSPMIERLRIALQQRNAEVTKRRQNPNN